MCNLYGYYRKTPASSTLAKIIPELELLKLRGRDSFGYVTVLEDFTSRVILSKLEPIFPAAKYFAFESRAIPEPELIEHASKGLNHDRDTQPFMNDKWITSHNGTIIQPELIRERFNLKPDSPVDSALLPELFKKKNPVRALREFLDGSFAVAAYNRIDHILYLMATFQPLYYVDSPDFIYYASVKEQLEYLGIPIEKVEPYTAVTFIHGVKKVDTLYRRDASNRVLVVLSGGLDSVTTARLYQVLGYEVSCLHIKYAQAAETIEDRMVERICKFYGYPLLVLDLRDVFKQCAKSSTLITHTRQSDVVKDAEGTPSYVGNRNMIFSSIAAGIAEENKMGRVVLGLNLSDGSGYPDNCLPYLLNMEETLKTSLNQQARVLYRSPFVNLMKHEVLQVAFAVGSPLQWQVSCYFPELDENDNPVYCDGCGSHLLRMYAFKHLKIKDPIRYLPQKKDPDFNFNDCKELGEEFYIRMRDKNLRLSPEEIPFWEQMKKTF